jgi:hypothetical protein
MIPQRTLSTVASVVETETTQTLATSPQAPHRCHDHLARWREPDLPGYGVDVATFPSIEWPITGPSWV